MRDIRATVIFIIFIFFIVFPGALSWGNPIQAGDAFPEIKLDIPKDVSYQKYLGVTGEGTFQIKDIKADVVIIQIFHSV